MKAYAIKPGEPGRMIEIENTLEALQGFVGGYIEPVSIFDNLILICNEEGKLRGMPYNCTVLGEIFVGPILLLGHNGEEFADLPDDFLKDPEWMKMGLGLR